MHLAWASAAAAALLISSDLGLAGQTRPHARVPLAALAALSILLISL